MSTAQTTHHQSEAELLEVLQSSLYPGASESKELAHAAYLKAKQELHPAALRAYRSHT